MMGLKQKLFIVLILMAGAMVWMFKGSEAKQKWVFRLKNKYENRKQMAERKLVARRGGVFLDDIEHAAYHN